MSLPRLPASVEVNAQITQSFATSRVPNTAGVLARKSLRIAPLHSYAFTVGPDAVAEVRAIHYANYGGRYLVAIREWDDYLFTNEILAWEISGGDTLAQLTRTYTPATGTRPALARDILILDESEVAFSFTVNNAPLTSGVSWSVSSSGLLTISSHVLTSGDIIRCNGQFRIPASLSDDLTRTVTRKETSAAAALVTIQGLTAEEVFSII